MTEITIENWKEEKFNEAKRLFSIDDIAIYDLGFTRFDETFGKVIDIKKSGIIYVAKANLKLIKRNKLDCPADCQLAGWGLFDPKKIISTSEEVRFFPYLYNNYEFDKSKGKRIDHYLIRWGGSRKSGAYNLRPIKPDNRGLVKISWDSIM